MNDLQKIIAGIVNDVISARFQADAVAAEYSRLYREDPLMKHMNAPLLNIRNVSVDLRLAFAEDEPSGGGNAGNTGAANARSIVEKMAVDEASTELRDKLFDKRSLKNSTLKGRQLAGAKNAVRSAIERTVTKNPAKSTSARTALVRNAIGKELSDRKIELSSSDAKALSRDLDRFSNKVATASAVVSAGEGNRRIVTNTEELSGLNPEAISSIKFDIDLEEMRWIDVESEDEDEAPGSVLSEG